MYNELYNVLQDTENSKTARWHISREITTILLHEWDNILEERENRICAVKLCYVKD